MEGSMPTIPGSAASRDDKIIGGLRFPAAPRISRYASEGGPPGIVTCDEWTWSEGADDVIRVARFFGACNLLAGPGGDGWEWQATADDVPRGHFLTGRAATLLGALDAAEQAAIAFNVRPDDLERKYLRLSAARDSAARRGEHAANEWRDAIRADVAAGVGVAWLAAVAGISRERVYQIRDGRR
jgi:hypothetical protein